jgi:hypothetical protein
MRGLRCQTLVIGPSAPGCLSFRHLFRRSETDLETTVMFEKGCAWWIHGADNDGVGVGDAEVALRGLSFVG